MKNIVNKALTKVVRPLQLKELFYHNVVDENPELFHEPESLFELDRFPADKIAVNPEALDAQLPFVAKINGGAETVPLISPAGLTPLGSPPETATLGPTKEDQENVKTEFES